MNHRQILHSFDSLKKPNVASFAECCTSKKPPKNVGEVRSCIQSQEIDAAAFEAALCECHKPDPAPAVDPPPKTKPNSKNRKTKSK